MGYQILPDGNVVHRKRDTEQEATGPHGLSPVISSGGGESLEDAEVGLFFPSTPSHPTEQRIRLAQGPLEPVHNSGRWRKGCVVTSLAVIIKRLWLYLTDATKGREVLTGFRY